LVVYVVCDAENASIRKRRRKNEKNEEWNTKLQPDAMGMMEGRDVLLYAMQEN